MGDEGDPVKAISPKLEAPLEASKLELPATRHSVDVYLDGVDVSSVGGSLGGNHMEIVLRCTVLRESYQDVQRVLMGGQMNHMLTLTVTEAPHANDTVSMYGKSLLKPAVKAGKTPEPPPRKENPLASSW